MRVPKAGKYQFCTVSNEASFSFLDGKELIHWPGRHTADRGVRGEVNALVDLKAGLHYLEYYHEEVTLEQMAFLGWRPSADEGPFSPIPETFYTAPHEGVVKALRGAEGAAARLRAGHHRLGVAGRAQRGAVHAASPSRPAPALPAGTTYAWDFGDGQKATGAEGRARLPDARHARRSR